MSIRSLPPVAGFALCTLLTGCALDSSLFGTPGADGFGGSTSPGDTSGGGFANGVGGASVSTSSNGAVTSASGSGGATSGSASTSAASTATTGVAASGATTTSATSTSASSSASSSASTSASSSASGGSVDHAIPCGQNQSCPGLCCLGLLNQDCKTTAAECNQFQSPIGCNDGADCDPGSFCCLVPQGFGKNLAECATTCQAQGSRVLCESLAECPSGGGYKSCSDATKLGLPGFKYCKK